MTVKFDSIASQSSVFIKPSPDQGAWIKFGLTWAQRIWDLARTPWYLPGILFLAVCGSVIPGEDVHNQLSL